MLRELINTAEQRTLLLTQIRRDGGTQPREGIDWEHVKDMQDALANGELLPAVSVTYDGSDYWLWDGFHRWHAYANYGRLDIPVVISQGTQDDAQWESLAANQSHGLKRTTADKERAIRAALKHPKSAGLSNQTIARHLGVSDKTVAKYREEMELSSEIPKIASRTVERNGQTYQQNTANIGANRPAAPAYASVWELEHIVRGLANHPEHYGAFDMKTGAELLRADARQRTGAFWAACVKHILTLTLAYRTTDLVQAINNLASQIEAKLNGTNAQPNPIRPAVAPRTAPATYTVPEARQDKPMPAWAADDSTGGDSLEETLRGLAEPEQPAAPIAKLLVDYTDEDWAAAAAAEKQRIAAAVQQQATQPPAEDWGAAIAGLPNKAARAHKLAPALIPWIEQYKDKHGRDWSDLARFGNPSHTNSVFWDDITRECKRRQVTIDEDVLKHAIRFAFDQLSAKVANMPLDPPLSIEELAAIMPDEIQPAADQSPISNLPVSQRDNYESDEWYTPQEYIDAARLVMGAIDLDPASSEMAQTVVRANVYLTRFDDGLSQTRWIHQRIWLNPPYSNPAPWIEKLLREHHAGPFCTEAIVLVNNATETSWFQLLLERFPVCLPARRLAFWRHDHANVGARQGQAFFYLGPNGDRFEEVFRQFGPILRRIT